MLGSWHSISYRRALTTLICPTGGKFIDDVALLAHRKDGKWVIPGSGVAGERMHGAVAVIADSLHLQHSSYLGIRRDDFGDTPSLPFLAGT